MNVSNKIGDFGPANGETGKKRTSRFPSKCREVNVDRSIEQWRDDGIQAARD